MPEKEITVAPKTNTLVKAQNDFFTNILGDLKKMNCVYTDYGKICGLNAIAEINHQLQKEGLQIDDWRINQASIVGVVQFAMMSELNTANKEIFIKFRNEEQNGKWVKNFECQPQYRGQMKLIQKFGVDVEHVYPIWIVREGDDFTYSTYKGVEITPPTWSPKGYTNPVIRVVVPIKYKNGEVQYHIAEKESLAINIKSQIKQTLLGWRSSGTGEGTKDGAVRIATLIKDMSLDELLKCEEIKKLINSTYTGISKEEMYITKLTLNATKRVMIDYGNAYVRELAEKTYDNADVYVKNHNARAIVEERAGIELSDVKEIEEEPKAIPQVDNNGEVKTITPEDFVNNYKKDDTIKPDIEIDDNDIPF